MTENKDENESHESQLKNFFESEKKIKFEDDLKIQESNDKRSITLINLMNEMLHLKWQQKQRDSLITNTRKFLEGFSDIFLV